MLVVSNELLPISQVDGLFGNYNDNHGDDIHGSVQNINEIAKRLQVGIKADYPTQTVTCSNADRVTW